MIVSLITMFFLGSLSILMFSNSAKKTPDSFKKLLKKLKPMQASLGLYGIFWGIFSLVFSIGKLGYNAFPVMGLLCSFWVIAMALPYGKDKLFKIINISNPVFKESSDEMLEKILSNQKIISIIGFVLCGLLVLSFLQTF